MTFLTIFTSALLLFMQTSFAKEACPSGEHWVESHFRRSYVKYDGTHVSASQVSGHCRKNPRGYDRWHQRLSNTRPKIWGYSGEKTKRWTIEEVEMAYEALSILPDQLLNQADIKLHRMDKSQHVNNPATANFNDIALYNLSFESKDSLAQILAHELSHIFFQNFSEQDKTEFRAAAGWIRDERTPGAFVVLKDKKFIQNDSKISIDEDFANHIEYYLFKAESLKRESPKAFLWIKNKFGDNFKIQETK